MIDIVIAVFVISSIGAGLAAVLVISDRFISNYGECGITVNDDSKITVEGGGSLLETLTEEKLFIPSACGGRGTCGLCKLKVLEGGGIVLPTEEPFLEADERQQGVRLACQIKVRNDLKIHIPEELFSVQEYECTCVDIKDLTYDIKLFRFELMDPPEIDYAAGQYVQLLAPRYPKSPEEVYRAYSIASDPAKKNIVEFIIRLVPGGICTTYCFEHLKVGDQVLFNGPYGEFQLSDTDAPVIFVAGGSGMAPVKCILHHMVNTNSAREAVFYFGANEVRDQFLEKEMEQFERDLPNFRFVPVVAKPAEEENWDGELGLVTEVVQQKVKNAPKAEAYLCGSPGMIDATTAVLTELGMPEANIFYDKFS